jgi:hypothetical protein
MTRLDEIENKWRDSSGEIDTSDVNWLIAHCRILEAHLKEYVFDDSKLKLITGNVPGEKE